MGLGLPWFCYRASFSRSYFPFKNMGFSDENEFLIDKVFTNKEMIYISNLNQKCYGIACCWAAKESVIKSLKSLINHEELEITINDNYIKDIETNYIAIKTKLDNHDKIIKKTSKNAYSKAWYNTNIYKN